MTNATEASERTIFLYQIFKFLVITGVAFKAVMLAQTAFPTLVSGDNDDIMRLMSIRAWLDGQSWFDMTQYRLLPPEGVSMHWSRYVDLGIASILVPLSKVLPMAVAEQWTLVIWPTLLLILLILVTARGTLLVLGPLAAGAALLSLVFWAPTSSLYFKVARIDHHSVQILLTSVLAFAMIWPGKPAIRGIIAGFAAALALAVGLETLPLLGVAGLIMLVRASIGRDGADQLLQAFCLTLVIASALLFVGQTEPASLLKSECDKLSPPLLAIAVVAAVASLVPMAAAPWIGHGMVRLGASAVLVALGLWLCAPLFLPCLDGPYGALPADIQTAIADRISEAQPGLVLASRKPLVYNGLVTSVIATLLLSGYFWLRRRRHADILESAGVGQMLILGMVGLIGSFFQIRAISMSGPALAFLVGYVIRCLLEYRFARQTPVSALLLFAGLTLTIFPKALSNPALLLVKLTAGEAAAEAIEIKPRDTDCRDAKILRALDTLPAATVYATQSMSTSIILTTHHNGMAAPYHRSRTAMMNDFYALDEIEDFKASLVSAGARYVVMCRGAEFHEKQKLAVALMKGDPVDFLRPLPFDSADLLVFEVLP